MKNVGIVGKDFNSCNSVSLKEKMKLKNYRKWDLVERGIALFLLLWFAYLMFAARNLKPEEINNKLTVAWIVSVFIFLAIIFIILPIINKLKKKIKKK